jgi:uncharacterized protein with PhoU and TrkA domain
VHRIERIADHTTSIAKSIVSLIESKANVTEGIIELLIEAAEIAFLSYDKAVQGFLSRQIASTNGIIDMETEIERLFTRIMPLPLSTEDNDTNMLYNLVKTRDGIEKISHLTADIAELTIDRAYKLEDL